MSKPYQVLFAGAGGCGKSPVANYLSWKFNLPRIENDALRNEVRGDLMGELDEPHVKEEYFKRLKERYDELHTLGWSFIDDCSIDRIWSTREQWYHPSRVPFIISFDLSYEFLKSHYSSSKREQIPHLERWVVEHEQFLELYGDTVNVHITEENYIDRMKICEAELRKFIQTL